jgi:hypothetical protein
MTSPTTPRHDELVKHAARLMGHVAWLEQAYPHAKAIPADLRESINALYQAANAPQSEKGPSKTQLAECVQFWRHYSTLNEPGQDEVAGEKDAMLEKMEGWL